MYGPCQDVHRDITRLRSSPTAGHCRITGGSRDKRCTLPQLFKALLSSFLPIALSLWLQQGSKLIACKPLASLPGPPWDGGFSLSPVLVLPHDSNSCLQ